ncbi:TPA: hypothetical protein I7730_00155 [Vibrio vulnificus]|uniref:Uncharacterized protein n=1 Tax=Vibrio vulnificus TaxID=672 RepID=A0A8H9K545_VIBVL|nr:hypothetical protein [Vibrio vulnificus]
MKVNYNNESISIYKLGQLSGCPLTSLYRAYHSGLRCGDAIVKEARKNLVEHEGKWISKSKLCSITQSELRKVQRRLKAGVSVNDAVVDKKDRRGATKSAKLSPSDALNIYASLFWKEKTQTQIASEFGVHCSTISDIWRHKRWGWLTAPLRYSLEQTKQQSELNPPNAGIKK